jgi:hypothetical protein
MCWQGNEDNTLIQVKSECRELFFRKNGSYLYHANTQTTVSGISENSLRISNISPSKIIPFVNAMALIYSPSRGHCLAQDGENIVYSSLTHLDAYGTGEYCHNETSEYKLLPGNNYFALQEAGTQCLPPN